MPSGGSEILLSNLNKHTSILGLADINLLLSTPNPNRASHLKKNILWQHLNHRDESLGSLNDQSFVKLIDTFVYVSNWQYEKFNGSFNLPTERSVVIKNAIDPIENLKKNKSEKIKLIYASAPFRGLDVLLDSFSMLNREDVELHIYSSTLMYGSDYDSEYSHLYKELIDQAKHLSGVFYHGYAHNDDVRTAMQESHIFAYPSIFEETSCLSLIEAGAAGCSLITTNLGALFETGSEYARFVPMQRNRKYLAKLYSSALSQAIDDYWTSTNQDLLKKQSEFYNLNYSWSKRRHEWERLFHELSSL
jgi:glycosyltransferase involved in cell wall biosynthesis